MNDDSRADQVAPGEALSDSEVMRLHEKRVGSILKKMRSCWQLRAAARSHMSARIDERHTRRWVTDIYNGVLKRVGVVGTTILLARLTRQQHSQRNSFSTIGHETGLSSEEVQIIYLLALSQFVMEMNRLNRCGVPDEPDGEWDSPYTATMYSAVDFERCAAGDVQMEHVA